jgi:hypothetical protein
VRVARRHLADQPAEAATHAPSAPAEIPTTAAAKGPEGAETTTPCDQDSEGTAVREFEDTTGRSWRAWPVTPRMARSRESRRQILGDYQEGWICFEALDNSGRRRLPRREPRWSDLPPDELQRLLAEAIDAPGRRERKSGRPTQPENRDIH